jgi:hypothetical protein
MSPEEVEKEINDLKSRLSEAINGWHRDLTVFNRALADLRADNLKLSDRCKHLEKITGVSPVG